jgi:hypothetical protein
MHETMQAIGFDQVTKTAQRQEHHVRSTTTAPTSIRARIGTALTRSTLGPTAGDHALGESQWWTRSRSTGD